MARAFTQAQKFGTEFSLSTEVVGLERSAESSDPDPTHVLKLADGRQVRARAVVVATGARYRRPQIPNLAHFEGHGVSYWASPAEARQCRDEHVALLGRKFGRTSCGVPRQPRTPRARAGSRAGARGHDVALSR
jgi:thioredoxin reductase (NADPH)